MRANRTYYDGIWFDSVYESRVYKLLKRKLFLLGEKRLYIHHPISFTGKYALTGVHVKPSWKVDFLVTDDKQPGIKPLFAVEAKGRFLQSDNFKFVLWDIFQEIPLFVVYQKTKPNVLINNGWVCFVHINLFCDLDINRQVNHIHEMNREKKQQRLIL